MILNGGGIFCANFSSKRGNWLHVRKFGEAIVMFL